METKLACGRVARLLAVTAGITVVVWGADPTLGTWKLDVAKSKFNPGPAFQSETRTYEAVAEGVKVTIRTVDAEGKTVVIEYPVNYDGKFYPVSGSGSPADAIALKKINENTAESTLMHGNQVVATVRRVISEDGKMMTITYKGADPTGRVVDYRLVYEKQ